MKTLYGHARTALYIDWLLFSQAARATWAFVQSKARSRS